MNIRANIRSVHLSSVTGTLGFQEVGVVHIIFHNFVKYFLQIEAFRHFEESQNCIIAKLTFSKYSNRYKIWISLGNYKNDKNKSK